MTENDLALAIKLSILLLRMSLFVVFATLLAAALVNWGVWGFAILLLGEIIYGQKIFHLIPVYVQRCIDE